MQYIVPGLFCGSSADLFEAALWSKIQSVLQRKLDKFTHHEVSLK